MDLANSVESLATELAQLEPSTDEGRAACTVVAERLHLARGPSGMLELFIEGSLESFGDTAYGRYLDFGRFRDVSAEREFNAVVVQLEDDPTAIRLMAHIAYEAAQILLHESGMDNETLLLELSPYLAMVAERSLLDPDEQKGLLAELLFLAELLAYLKSEGRSLDQGLALQAWKGWEGASRDFSGGNAAVEVKATSRIGRRHEVSSLMQLMPDAAKHEERIYIYSVGILPDLSRTFRLLTQVERIEDVLNSEQKAGFHERLRAYGGRGFLPELRSHYRLARGFQLRDSPAIFRVDNIAGRLTPDSFVGGRPPERVEDVRYTLSLEGLVEISKEERQWLYCQLLGLSS